ncbi:hypothetical protein ACWGOQ_0002660 [Aquimarina sp. M1]
MGALTFSNTSSGNSSLYLAPKDIFWCAFLLPEDRTVEASSITFEDTAQYGGYYLFAINTPKDVSAFVTNAQAYFKSVVKPYQTGGIAWIQSPDGPLNSDTIQLIYLQGATKGFALLQNYSYNFGNNFSTLTLSALNVSITLDTTNNRFVITGPPNGFIVFKANNIASKTIPHNGLEIPLTGLAMAGMRFMVGLNHGIDFDSFDTALKYFYNNNDTGDLMQMSYPLFQDGSQNDYVQFQASINPIDLLNEQQLSTYLAFLGKSTNNNNDEEKDTVMPSNFRSDYGIPVHLLPNVDTSTLNGSENIPSATSSMLVFSERAIHDDTDNWYTIPSGYFTIGIDAENISFLDVNNQLRILCGLSGTESISVTAETTETKGDYFAFIGKKPAYVPQYPILQLGNKVGSNTAQQSLSDTFCTAWIGLVRNNVANASIVYHSQPQGSSLYAPNKSDKESLFLDYYVANSGTLSDITEVAYFPMVGYGLHTKVPVTVSAQNFELQILTPRRKINISNALSKQASDRVSTRNKNKSSNVELDTAKLVDSTSPQGFFIQVSEETFTWEKMELASNQFIKSNGELSQVYTLAFNELNATLQSSFQTNQLFLVASSDVDNVLGDFANQMEIEEWPFDLNVPKPNPEQPNTGQYSNIVIFKYCDQTLQERVQNIQFWTNPEAFNDTTNNGLPNLSNWINDYIQKGIDKYKEGDNDYYKFYTVATDPNWKGVIALKVDISLTNFPPELQGLLAGINLDEFNAHHFGIDLSVVKNTAGSIEMEPTSSLFALIDYEDDTYQQYDSNITEYMAKAPINTSVDYVYNVLLLKVLFTNSKIINFNSYIAFTINNLFGETVKPDTRDNLLILDGTYENHNGVPSYTFSATGDNILPVDSTIIRDVEILKANFVTAVSQDGSSSGNVASRFSFFGYVNFYALEGFDLLSFGSEEGEPPNGQGIAFSNMYIDLTFPLDTPTNQTFTFDIAKMAFDIGSSTARQGSLYRHFPLQLTGMVSGTKDNNPASQGYLNVQLPALKQQQPISGDWYGLTFKLNMGTLGSLASAAGFNTTFMTPWNVGGTGAVAGLKLPGVNPQAPSLSLQGVLKMDIGSIRIDIAEDKVSYLMKINNIALKVLSLTFPPGGQIGFFLFGNPSETAPPESLGWYAAYLKN